MKRSRNQSIELVFRGFSVSPEEVEALMGVRARRLVQKNAIQPDGISPFKRSAISFTVDFSKGCVFFEMLPTLLKHLKGVDNICKVRDIIQPEFLEIDIALPIKDLNELRGRSFDLESIADLYKLRATLSFSFL
jgi:hypothetical protein